MKKSGIINRYLSKQIASMGHGDFLVITDAGLSIPKEVDVVDLAVSKNIPRFLEVLKAILLELEIEKVIIASEIKIKNLDIYTQIFELFQDIKIEEVNHNEFKKLSNNARTFVRTGEFSPYANIILVTGVVF